MKKYQIFLSENFQFLEVNFSTYLNRRVFVMIKRYDLLYFRQCFEKITDILSISQRTSVHFEKKMQSCFA